MANAILAYPDYVLADARYVTVAFSGGSWRPALPLTNLRQTAFAAVARSADLAAASTRFWCDLGVTRDVSVLAIPRSNMTTGAQYRIRACTTQDTASVVHDTGWLPLYAPAFAAQSLYWGHPSLWDGVMSPEDAATFPMPVLLVLPEAVLAQFWFVELSDPLNPAGYIDIPRLVIAPGWQPRINMSWGGSLTTEDGTVVQQALGGGEFFDPRPKRRVARFTLPGLSDAEAMTWASDMQTRLGVSGQLFFVHDPADVSNRHRRSFLCRMRALTGLEYTAFGNFQQAFELAEIVA